MRVYSMSHNDTFKYDVDNMANVYRVSTQGNENSVEVVCIGMNCVDAKAEGLYDLGKPLPEWLKTETNRIHGCASKLWITGTKNLKDGTMSYHADGESHITKGTAVVVTNLVNGQKAEEVASLTVEDFTPLGIKELLTMQRQNGLGELINRIIGIANANIHV